MAPKYHPTPLSGADRKALSKELVKSRAMTGILAERSQEKRRVGEALIREADNLACQSWNEKMWSDGGPAQPSPTIGHTVMKIVIIAGATLAVVTAAGAADLPRPQPVYQQAQLGKMPIGKAPIGKTLIGKAPVVTRTY
jgi:hypothetical protein